MLSLVLLIAQGDAFERSVDVARRAQNFQRIEELCASDRKASSFPAWHEELRASVSELILDRPGIEDELEEAVSSANGLIAALCSGSELDEAAVKHIADVCVAWAPVVELMRGMPAVGCSFICEWAKNVTSEALLPSLDVRELLVGIKVLTLYGLSAFSQSSKAGQAAVEDILRVCNALHDSCSTDLFGLWCISLEQAAKVLEYGMSIAKQSTNWNATYRSFERIQVKKVADRCIMLDLAIGVRALQHLYGTGSFVAAEDVREYAAYMGVLRQRLAALPGDALDEAAMEAEERIASGDYPLAAMLAKPMSAWDDMVWMADCRVLLAKAAMSRMQARQPPRPAIDPFTDEPLYMRPGQDGLCVLIVAGPDREVGTSDDLSFCMREFR